VSIACGGLAWQKCVKKSWWSIDQHSLVASFTGCWLQFAQISMSSNLCFPWDYEDHLLILGHFSSFYYHIMLIYLVAHPV
jgi:hypothetical protein